MRQNTKWFTVPATMVSSSGPARLSPLEAQRQRSMNELRTAREERTMPPQTIGNRVDRLEQRVTELERLPDRMSALESQIVQLRAEMRDEFSAVRQEIRAGDEETRRVLGERIDETNRHMRVLHEDVIGRLAVIQEGLPTAPRKRRGK